MGSEGGGGIGIAGGEGCVHAALQVYRAPSPFVAVIAVTVTLGKIADGAISGPVTRVNLSRRIKTGLKKHAERRTERRQGLVPRCARSQTL